MFREVRITRVCACLALMAMAITAMTVTGCAPPSGSVVKAGVLRSEKPRLLAPSLGSAPVPELVEGNISIESAPGQGTRITLIVPIEQNAI